MLSGGHADSSASDPWILSMLDFIRKTGSDGQTKMLGICWGHQALLRAFGGRVGPVPNGPVAGLVRVGLTAEGKKFFPFAAATGSLLAMQFHVRQVLEATDVFVMLVEGNESFVSKNNMMLGIQAHPEIGGIFAKAILEGEETGEKTYTIGQSKSSVEEMKAKIEEPQDGLDILRRIVEWVGEK